MHFHTRPKKPLTINIVALIDILCILLIFFVVTTTFKKDEPEVEIKVPDSSQGENKERTEDPVVIYITKDEELYFGKDKVLVGQLKARIESTKSQNPKTIFTLKADEGVPLGFFVKVLDVSKEAGLKDMGFYTQDPNKKK